MKNKRLKIKNTYQKLKNGEHILFFERVTKESESRSFSLIMVIGLALLLWVCSATPALGANEYTVMSILRYNPGVVNAQQMDSYIAGVYSNSPLVGHSQMWIDAGNKYGVDPVFLMDLAILESGWGFSDFARDRNNLYGWMAYDSDPGQAMRFSSFEACTDYVAGQIVGGYLTPGGWNYSYRCGPTLAGMSDDVPPHYPYATSRTWAGSIAILMNEFASTTPGYPYPPTWGIYDATYKLIESRSVNANNPLTMYANTSYQVAVKVINTGQIAWSQGGFNPFRLGYYWYSGNTQVTLGTVAASLPADLYPGQSAVLIANVVTPPYPGSYTLKFDMIQEGVTWFSARWVPTLNVLASVSQLLYRADAIQTISSSEMVTYPDGADLKARPGTLVKTSNSVDIYVTDLVAGTYYRRAITSAAVFEALGYKWEDVITISDSELSTYTNGSAVSDTSLHPNGALVKTSSSSSVFLLEEGKRRLITSPASFVSYGFRWDRIVPIPDAEMASYPSGPDLKARPGTLIKGGSPSVYVTDLVGGTYYKRPIASAAVFSSLGYHWEDIMTVSDTELASYTDGYTISIASHPNGSLVKTSSSDVYLLEEGKRRRIASPYGCFEAHHAAYALDDSIISTMKEGSQVAVSLNLKNTGAMKWESSGSSPVRLSYQWIKTDTDLVSVSDGLRTALPSDVSLMGEISLSAQVQAPNQAGMYILKWDLIREGTTPAWFSAQCGPPKYVLVKVHPPYPSGALIKTFSSPSVFYLEGGQKRLLTYASFVSHGFRWDRIVSISSSEMATYSDGLPLRARPGTLIKGNGSSVYVTDLVGGTYYKRLIASAAVFTSLGYHWEDVVTVSDTELSNYTDGGAVSDASLHPNGSLIKTASSPDVFYLEGGQKRLLTYASFVSHGFRWDRIITISDSEIQTYSPGSGLKARPGTLLKGGTPSIYVVDLDGGAPVRRGIASPTVFESLDYSWYGIITVSDSELLSYTLGTTLQ